MEALLRPELQAGVRLSDFIQDPATGVHMAPGSTTPAGYLDGAEELLLRGLPAVSDRSTGSDELTALMRDWATTYHLTPYRATLLDCLGLTAAGDASVLELGAGCGAVTRWLGEHFGTVDAVEGSPNRARVALARCADLEAVSVYSGNYSELVASGYDVTTLIGVLEYGHLYHPDHAGDPEAAALANLAVARRSLADDGVLLIAVENRLGLKYLNGAREDHSGRLFEGIQGYVHPGTPVTWSARELERMVLQAGFRSAQFLLPFPDYKLARTVVNPERVTDEHHIESWLMGVAPDRGAQRLPLLFNESLAIGEIARAGLLRDLANSFLVVAYAGDRETAETRLGIETGWAARHYSLDRRAGLRKRATLRGEFVEHEPAPFGDAGHEQARSAVEAVGLRFAPAREPHRRGSLLSAEVLRTVLRDGFGDAFVAHVTEHRRWLLDHFGAGKDGLVRGSAWDVTWWNVVRDAGTGERHIIDTEWELTRSLPVDYVLWRMLLHFLRNHRPEFPAPLRELDPGTTVGELLRAAGGELTPESESAFAELEDAVLRLVSPAPLTDRLVHALDAVDALSRGRIVVALADEVTRRPELLATYAAVVTPTDPVTLVLYAPDADPAEIATRIERAMASAGLSEQDSPDLLLLAVPRDDNTEATLAQDAIALLSDTAAGDPFDRLRRVGSNGTGQLRRLLAPPQLAPGVPTGIAAAAEQLAAGVQGRVVELGGGAARPGWITCDPSTVAPRELVGTLEGNVIVGRVSPRRLRKDDCLRSVLEIALDCANTLVLYASDSDALRSSLRSLGVRAGSVSHRDQHAVVVVRAVPAA